MPVHRSAAETLDGFFPAQLDRCLKRGQSDEKKCDEFFIGGPGNYFAYGSVTSVKVPGRNSLPECKSLIE